MFELASFAIAVITLLVAITAFLLGDPQSSPGLRYGLAGFFFSLTLVFTLIGIFALLGGINSETAESMPPTRTVQTHSTTSLQAMVCQDISKYPGNFLSMERIPAGDSMTITVQNGEIHAVTAGTISVAGVSLRGGRDRGSVVILLPSATYTITQLTPTWNWRGAFRLEPNEWNALAHVLAAQQRIPGTCSDPNGCNFVDVLVVGPDGIISQYEEKGPLAFDCSR
jgi:hypothetical protein